MVRTLIVLSGGHPFDEEPFANILASLEGWDVTHLRHPDAEMAVAQGAADHADALLFYDMPGYDFTSGEALARAPDPAFCDHLRARFRAGKGAVAMHHALAGWAAWPEWAEWLGGRFLYRPDRIHGVDRLDSGYRHDVDYIATVVSEHPITADMAKSFPVCDELYLAEIFTDRITPLLRSDYAFERHNFYSASQAVTGHMFSNEGWDHPDGSNLVAWLSRAENAHLVYLQCGDGPATYDNPQVRLLIANALDFIASGDAP